MTEAAKTKLSVKCDACSGEFSMIVPVNSTLKNVSCPHCGKALLESSDHADHDDDPRDLTYRR